MKPLLSPPLTKGRMGGVVLAKVEER